MESSVMDFHGTATHSSTVSPSESPSDSTPLSSSASTSPPKDIPRTKESQRYQQEENSVGSFEVLFAISSLSAPQELIGTLNTDSKSHGRENTSENTDHSMYSSFPPLSNQGGRKGAQYEEKSMQHHSSKGKRKYFSGLLSRPSSPAPHATENSKTLGDNNTVDRQPQAACDYPVEPSKSKEVAKLPATQKCYQPKIESEINIALLKKNEVHYFLKRFSVIPNLLEVSILVLPNSDHDGVCWHEIRVEATLAGKLLADVKNKMVTCTIDTSTRVKLREGWTEGKDIRNCQLSQGSVNYYCQLVRPDQLCDHPSKTLQFSMEFVLYVTDVPVLTSWVVV